MNTSTFLTGEMAGSRVTTSGGNGVLGRILGAVVKAREAYAQREVNRYLARQPDRLLRDIGFDEGAIAELRAMERH